MIAHTSVGLALASSVLAARMFRSYTVECVDLPSAECDAVAGIVADAQPTNQIGDLMTVGVELVDCPEAGRAFFLVVELSDPNVERCWLVSLAYEDGDLQRVAYREFGGPIQLP